MTTLKFGLKPEKLKEEHFLELISCGSVPAEYMYRSFLKNNQIKLHKLNNEIIKLRENGTIFSDYYKELPRNKILASLFSIREKVNNLPLRAALNPSMGKKLATKISKLDKSILIKEVERGIKYESLEIEGITFNTHEINKLRFSIIWLNQFVNQPKDLNVNNKCLSNDAYKIFITDGFEGLYKIAKRNKRYLKKIFLECDEIRNYKFFKFASLNFEYIWNVKFTKTDREKIPAALDALYFDDDRGNQDQPVYYVFNEAIDMKRLKYFTDNGYQRLGQIQVVDINNYDLYKRKEIFKTLYDTFGKIKI